MENQKTFRPGDKVLVRNADNKPWHLDLFASEKGKSPYVYHTMKGYFRQCIPLEGNEELVDEVGETATESEE